MPSVNKEADTVRKRLVMNREFVSKQMLLLEIAQTVPYHLKKSRTKYCIMKSQTQENPQVEGHGWNHFYCRPVG